MDVGRASIGGGVGGGGGGGGSGGVSAALSPTTNLRQSGGSYKRKRNGGGIDDSPVTAPDGEDEDHDRTRNPPVKRACNECRQQKLKCDAVQDPWAPCKRCNRLNLTCKIDSNFKRVGKRSKHAEMEKELERLRHNLAQAQAQGYTLDDEDSVESPVQYTHSRHHSFIGSEEAVSSLLHLKQGGSYAVPRYVKHLGEVGLTQETIDHLFDQFFTCYHPYLPFLDPYQPSEEYFEEHPLLFWAIIAVAARRSTGNPGLLTSLSAPFTDLLWKTIGDVPNNYFVVKALCLICTWPFPTSTTSTDPTHILGGVMMKAATGIGLHRPNNTQDFSRISVDLNRKQLHDRVTTWAVCNIVAQSLATGYGQPASTLYDWTLAVRPGQDGPFTLSPELESRVQIEKLCDEVSKDMYSNATDPRGVAGDEVRASFMRSLRRKFTEIKVSILSRDDISPYVEMHLKAAQLHFRLSAFYDSSTTKSYLDDLMALYRNATAFLGHVFSMEKSPIVNKGQGLLRFATGYILQMIVAACFTLLKLLSSFFANEIDFEHGRGLFHDTIRAIRTMSITNNDLPWRLAELMVQMWNGARVEARRPMQSAGNPNHRDSQQPLVIDDSLQLKVRCRMSMSLVFDSIWRWREEFQAQGRTLDAAAKYPTAPDSSVAASSASSTHPSDSALLSNRSVSVPPPPQQLSNSLLAAANSMSPNHMQSLSNNHILSNALSSNSDYAMNNYEVFDPLSWMFDGLVDLPYSGMFQGAGLEAGGVGSMS